MSAAVASRVGYKFSVVVKDGPDKGVMFQLLPPKVTIGRGADCHVMLTDPRMSRMAASVEFSMEDILIKDLSGKNLLSVNGVKGVQFSLKNGDRIEMGQTRLDFAIEALALDLNSRPRPETTPVALGVTTPSAVLAKSQNTALSTMTPFQPPPVMPFPGTFGGGPAGGAPRASAMPSQGAPNQMRVALIGIIVVGAAAWAFQSKTASHKSESGLRTNEVVEKEINSSESRVEELLRHRHFASAEEETRFNEAHRHYQEGFRDYQNHQFQRAIRSFETALAIDPDHDLASRYLKLASRERDEMVAFFTLEGRSYKDKHMYSRCSAAFAKVLDVIADKNDLKYKQAETLKNECDLLTAEKFR